MGRMSRITESVLITVLGVLGFSSCSRSKTNLEDPNGVYKVKKEKTGGKKRKHDAPVCIYGGPNMMGGGRVLAPVEEAPVKDVPAKSTPTDETTEVKPVKK